MVVKSTPGTVWPVRTYVPPGALEVILFLSLNPPDVAPNMYINRLPVKFRRSDPFAISI